MKQIYMTLVVMAAGFTSLHAQQTDKQLGTIVSPSEQKAIIEQVQTRTFEMRGAMGGSCDSLIVETAGGNSFNGNMFDVNVLNTITIETFSVSIDPGSWNIAVFHKTGTFVGSETTAGDWTFLDSAQVSGAGEFNLAKVPLNLGLVLNGGSTHAFYVTATSSTPAFYYTNGTTLGALKASDANLEVLEGKGGGYPFSVTFSPRVFNGSVYYCLGAIGVDEQELKTSFNVYPNPANQTLSIDMNGCVGKNVSVTVYNAVGEMIYTEKMYNTSAVKTLDVSSFADGVYVAEMIVEGVKTNTRFVVAK